jgi:hypothetical protein
MKVVETRFDSGLHRIFDAPSPGVLFSGGFGTGKSHLLGYLREVALSRDFVVSVVSVSKETPLSIPGVMFAAAMRNATVRAFNDDPIALALAEVQRREGAVRRLDEWATTSEPKLSPVFSAMLYLLNRNMESDLLRGLEAFLAGGKPPLPAMRRALKDAGARSLFDLAAVAPADLTRQRMRFVPRLFEAAGFAGWVVLIDELELIGRYGPLQRALAYVELDQWLGLDDGLRIPGLFGVAAISDDYEERVINNRQDDEKLTERLRQRNAARAADLALAAMRAIQKADKLDTPGDADLRRHEVAIRACYEEAYDWRAEPAAIGERRANRTLRHHIRGWITQWDMMRVAGARTGVIERAATADYSQSDLLTEKPDGFDESA